MNLLDLIRYMDYEASEKTASVNYLDLLTPEKTAGAWDTTKKIVSTPFKNIYGGAKDYMELRPQRAEEIQKIHQDLNAAARQHISAGKDVQAVPESVAKKVWKKNSPMMIDEGKEVPDHNAAVKTTQHRIGEAKGRFFGGLAQIGIPSYIGYRMLKKPEEETPQE